MSGRTAIVAGSMAQPAGNGGLTWVFLQYVLGFRELGFDVLFLDRLEPEMCLDVQGRPCTLEESKNLGYLEHVMRSFDLEHNYALLYDKGSRCFGKSRDEVNAIAERADLLLNVNGFADDTEVLERVRLRIFLDIDPGFLHMWRELGLHDAFTGHDAYVTVGENVGQPDCEVPTGEIEWITTAQPVVLGEWPYTLDGNGSFTGVGAWRGPFAPVEYRGVTYGLRVHEFRKFMELPTHTSEHFEIALDIDDAEVSDLARLRENGWSLVDPRTVTSDPAAYRRYIQCSKAELMVAKNMYVASRSGWFSDRSICYLASGKPVVAEETGFSKRYPTGEGLHAFETLDDAVAAVEAIASDYERQSRAARSLAEEHFEAKRVLGSLLERVGVAS